MESLTIPIDFRCPISLDLMKDPVTLSTGTTYDRDSIETWIESGHTSCPVTNQRLRSLDLVPNHTLRKMIQDWCVENKSNGIERIPTPKIPITSHEVLNILSQLDDASSCNDLDKCKELVSKIKVLARESDRNKRCIVENGVGITLSSIFDRFSRWDFVDNDCFHVLEEILSILAIITSPFDDETRRNLSTSPSLEKIVWFLRFGSLSQRRNAVLILKELICKDQDKVDDVAKIEGSLEALVNLITEHICSSSTKASLLVMYHMVTSTSSSSENKKVIIDTFVKTGLLQILVEMVVDSERSVCERALGVIDGIFSHSEGKEKGYENALIVPVLVKKILRVSDLATEFSVSILWKLGRDDDNRGVIVEALRVGAFQKLLLLLQIGCNEVTKEKVSELLKLMNVCKNNSVEECSDSLDF